MIGVVAFQLALPPESKIHLHLVFHIFVLKKALPALSQKIPTSITYVIGKVRIAGNTNCCESIV